MKFIKRYLRRALLAFVAFLVGIAAYLVVPPFWIRIPDVPRQAPVTFVPDSKNHGQRCEPATVYVASLPEHPEGYEVVNPLCAALQNELLDAALWDNTAKVKELLAQGANPNGRGERYGEYSLPLPTVAHAGGRFETTRLLLDNGADVNEAYVCCATQASPLISSVWHDEPEMAKLFLSRGANLNLTTMEGHTAFEVAQCYDKSEFLFLLDAAGGASLEQRLEYRVAWLLRRKQRSVHIFVTELRYQTGLYTLGELPLRTNNGKPVVCFFL